MRYSTSAVNWLMINNFIINSCSHWFLHILLCSKRDYFARGFTRHVHCAYRQNECVCVCVLCARLYSTGVMHCALHIDKTSQPTAIDSLIIIRFRFFFISLCLFRLSFIIDVCNFLSNHRFATWNRLQKHTHTQTHTHCPLHIVHCTHLKLHRTSHNHNINYKLTTCEYIV